MARNDIDRIRGKLKKLRKGRPSSPENFAAIQRAINRTHATVEHVIRKCKPRGGYED